MSRLLSLAYSREIDAAEPKTARGLDRLVAFTDAVVAIAITLVVLPLVDAAASGHETATALLAADGYRLGAAAVSFLVIGSLWRRHHVVFERAAVYTDLVLQTNLAWLAAVVFLPVPTALLFSPSSHGAEQQAVVGVYAGVLAIAQLALAICEIDIRRRCLAPDAAKGPRDWLQWVTVLITAVTAVLAFTGLGTHALFVLLLGLPAEWISLELARRHRLRTPVSGRSPS